MLFLLVAVVAVVEPQVPDVTPKPPSLSESTDKFNPVPMLAVAVPVGAILKIPVTDRVDAILLAPLPENIKLL